MKNNKSEKTNKQETKHSSCQSPALRKENEIEKEYPNFVTYPPKIRKKLLNMKKQEIEKEYFEMRMQQEKDWWNNPKNIILNYLTFGIHGLKHVGLI